MCTIYDVFIILVFEITNYFYLKSIWAWIHGKEEGKKLKYQPKLKVEKRIIEYQYEAVNLVFNISKILGRRLVS